ncbi:11639_t:CDS:2 [Cetraspora pellucida]|uniref:11639_t:CDS:1 n=1 Tax=Cetraspora pellucida TaxID=1433469 RepID=A0ACA9K204_9GLOM|nr:11639_t:CDS:2 [Cetraspora pellucida]
MTPVSESLVADLRLNKNFTCGLYGFGCILVAGTYKSFAVHNPISDTG